MITVIHDLALVFTGAGLVAAALALVRTRQILWAMTILLDFFTAAGLLRLVGPPTWRSLATVTLTISIRQLASLGLRLAHTRSG
jgi:hypothetical protein